MATAAPDQAAVLLIGTEVSAKYRGAFCEARIKNVEKLIKCKVMPKDGGAAFSVTDDDVKGVLKIGNQVEAKSPHSGEDVDCTLVKITDASSYTVVFDDGDVVTLRRTQLCLKGDKHFLESETLDQLPLTHPEHFGTPVVQSTKKEKRRRSGFGLSTSSQGSEDDDDNSEDESRISVTSTGHGSSVRHALAAAAIDKSIGRVVLISAVINEKKKWFPALVILPSNADTDNKSKDMVHVKSFKDSKVSSLPKKETKDYTKDSPSKCDVDKSTKLAFDRAAQYTLCQELPPSWNKKDLLGIADSDDESDKSEDEYEDTNGTGKRRSGDAKSSSDDEPTEEKDRFVAQLYKYMDDSGAPINKAPRVNGRELNLHKLFHAVRQRGGYNKTSSTAKWKDIGNDMGLPSAASQLKRAYKQYLLSFEDFYRKVGDMTHFESGGRRSVGRSGSVSLAGASASSSSTGRSVLTPKERELSAAATAAAAASPAAGKSADCGPKQQQQSAAGGAAPSSSNKQQQSTATGVGRSGDGASKQAPATSIPGSGKAADGGSKQSATTNTPTSSKAVDSKHQQAAAAAATQVAGKTADGKQQQQPPAVSTPTSGKAIDGNGKQPFSAAAKAAEARVDAKKDSPVSAALKRAADGSGIAATRLGRDAALEAKAVVDTGTKSPERRLSSLTAKEGKDTAGAERASDFTSPPSGPTSRRSISGTGVSQRPPSVATPPAAEAGGRRTPGSSSDAAVTAETSRRTPSRSAKRDDATSAGSVPPKKEVERREGSPRVRPDSPRGAPLVTRPSSRGSAAAAGRNAPDKHLAEGGGSAESSTKVKLEPDKKDDIGTGDEQSTQKDGPAAKKRCRRSSSKLDIAAANAADSVFKMGTSGSYATPPPRGRDSDDSSGARGIEKMEAGCFSPDAISTPTSCSDNNMSPLGGTVLIDVDYPPGSKVKIRYGRTKTTPSNSYDAKINEVVVEDSGHIAYFVHYAGWNVRYDEWVKSDRIVGPLSKVEKRKMWVTRVSSAASLKKKGAAIRPVDSLSASSESAGSPGSAPPVVRSATPNTKMAHAEASATCSTQQTPQTAVPEESSSQADASVDSTPPCKAGADQDAFPVLPTVSLGSASQLSTLSLVTVLSNLPGGAAPASASAAREDGSDVQSLQSSVAATGVTPPKKPSVIRSPRASSISLDLRATASTAMDLQATSSAAVDHKVMSSCSNPKSDQEDDCFGKPSPQSTAVCTGKPQDVAAMEVTAADDADSSVNWCPVKEEPETEIAVPARSVAVAREPYTAQNEQVANLRQGCGIVAAPSSTSPSEQLNPVKVENIVVAAESLHETKVMATSCQQSTAAPQQPETVVDDDHVQDTDCHSNESPAASCDAAGSGSNEVAISVAIPVVVESSSGAEPAGAESSAAGADSIASAGSPAAVQQPTAQLCCSSAEGCAEPAGAAPGDDDIDAESPDKRLQQNLRKRQQQRRAAGGGGAAAESAASDSRSSREAAPRPQQLPGGAAATPRRQLQSPTRRVSALGTAGPLSPAQAAGECSEVPVPEEPAHCSGSSEDDNKDTTTSSAEVAAEALLAATTGAPTAACSLSRKRKAEPPSVAGTEPVAQGDEEDTCSSRRRSANSAPSVKRRRQPVRKKATDEGGTADDPAADLSHQSPLSPPLSPKLLDTEAWRNAAATAGGRSPAAVVSAAPGGDASSLGLDSSKYTGGGDALLWLSEAAAADRSAICCPAGSASVSEGSVSTTEQPHNASVGLESPQWHDEAAVATETPAVERAAGDVGSSAAEKSAASSKHRRQTTAAATAGATTPTHEAAGNGAKSASSSSSRRPVKQQPPPRSHKKGVKGTSSRVIAAPASDHDESSNQEVSIGGSATAVLAAVPVNRPSPQKRPAVEVGSKSPRQPKYNFNISEELSKMDRDKRIAYIYSKMCEVRRLYNEQKNELLDMDRRRKKRSGKMAAAAAAAASSGRTPTVVGSSSKVEHGGSTMMSLSSPPASSSSSSSSSSHQCCTNAASVLCSVSSSVSVHPRSMTL